MRARYKYLEIGPSRHGKPTVYFRRGDGPRVRLPDDLNSVAFDEAYHAAFNGRPLPHVRDMPISAIEKRKQATERALVGAIGRAKCRAREKCLGFDLTLDWALNTVEKQSFRCALTGIEFFAPHQSAGSVNPYVPSLDQIRAGKGYTQGNVRIVVFAINAMMLDWGDDVFEQVVNSYRYWKGTKNKHSIPAPLWSVPAPKK